MDSQLSLLKIIFLVLWARPSPPAPSPRRAPRLSRGPNLTRSGGFQKVSAALRAGLLRGCALGLGVRGSARRPPVFTLRLPLPDLGFFSWPEGSDCKVGSPFVQQVPGPRGRRQARPRRSPQAGACPALPGLVEGHPLVSRRRVSARTQSPAVGLSIGHPPTPCLLPWHAPAGAIMDPSF